MSKIGIDIEKAKQILQQGGLVAIPTETVYGLAANGLDKNAVLKIFEAKNRPHFDPLIIHTNSIDKIKQWVTDVPAWAQQLANAFWPGPLTLLLPQKKIIPDLVTSGLPQVAVRIPNHKLTLQLLQNLDFPLAAPSANPFGYVSPTTAQHVAAQLQNKVDYILDGGICDVGIESTIVGFENNQVTIYRLGGLAIEDIEQVVGKINVQLNQSSNPAAPGMLKSHYAPTKPLFIGDVNGFIKSNPTKKIGVISFYKGYDAAKNQVKILSPKQDLKEAAHNLFAAIRELDACDIDVIIAEKFPDNFLGRAINDRLQRASAK
ncbi:MAG TPA: L-threonylcarbamoyladenylate synthase [Bacteroidia bacterium]|nr:L-threonylcarbamoyladenylate synthase [Bacteroidia bacterium]